MVKTMSLTLKVKGQGKGCKNPENWENCMIQFK